MTNKKNWMGMLVIVLVCGIAVIACDDGSLDRGGNPFVGTWTGFDPNFERIKIVGRMSSFNIYY